MSANPFEEASRFLRAFIVHPREIGAVAPSSAALARAVAAQIDLTRSGPILELGPGTGALTRGILARGIAPERLTLIEYDSAMAKSLAEKFAGVQVINGDAFDLEKTLSSHSLKPFAATVSGLPLLNFPLEKRDSLVRAAFEKMEVGAPFIQFSYGFHSPVPASADVTVKLAAFVWMNLPPARVWVYRKR